MGILDKIGSLADRLHIGSEDEYEQTWQQQEAYGEQDGAYDPYGYQQQQQEYYEEPAPQQRRQQPRQQETYYEPNYNTGGAYVTGVRPRTASKQKPKFSLRGLFSRGQEQREEYPPPPQQYADNVIPIGGYDQGGGYEPAPRRQQQGGYAERPQEQAAPRAQQNAPRQATAKKQGSTMIYLVRRLEESEDIIEHMMNGGNVIVNMEEVDETLKRRVLDFISGAAYALGCVVKRISYRNYFIAPAGEEVLTNVSNREPEPEARGYRPQERQYDW